MDEMRIGRKREKRTLWFQRERTRGWIGLSPKSLLVTWQPTKQRRAMNKGRRRRKNKKQKIYHIFLWLNFSVSYSASSIALVTLFPIFSQI
jgi:hypothetical protein